LPSSTRGSRFSAAATSATRPSGSTASPSAVGRSKPRRTAPPTRSDLDRSPETRQPRPSCRGSRDLDGVGARAARAFRERGRRRCSRPGRVAQRAGHRPGARSRSRGDVPSASRCEERSGADEARDRSAHPGDIPRRARASEAGDDHSRA
jgi:hypothetical protein